MIFELHQKHIEALKVSTWLHVPKLITLKSFFSVKFFSKGVQYLK